MAVILAGTVKDQPKKAYLQHPFFVHLTSVRLLIRYGTVFVFSFLSGPHRDGRILNGNERRTNHGTAHTSQSVSANRSDGSDATRIRQHVRPVPDRSRRQRWWSIGAVRRRCPRGRGPYL